LRLHDNALETLLKPVQTDEDDESIDEDRIRYHTDHIEGDLLVQEKVIHIDPIDGISVRERGWIEMKVSR